MPKISSISKCCAIPKFWLMNRHVSEAFWRGFGVRSSAEIMEDNKGQRGLKSSGSCGNGAIELQVRFAFHVGWEKPGCESPSPDLDGASHGNWICINN